MVKSAPVHKRKIDKTSHVYLVDGSSYIFRAYHALPPLTRKSDGLPIGAVAGFCNMLWKLLRDMEDMARPTHIAVLFDTSRMTFRNTIYEAYKANRPEAPEDLVPQFPLIRDAVRAFNVACLEQDGFEADDLIATYARQAYDAGAKVTIVGSDKDLMQLVNERITMLDTMKDRPIQEPQVQDKFGIGPERVIDVQALAGDSSDNVPGVPGIGIKTAALLINEYGDLDALLARADEIKQNKRRENLLAFADQARLSRDLVTLRQDVPVERPVESLAVTAIDIQKLLHFFADMELNQLTRRLVEAFGVDEADIPAPKTKPKTNGVASVPALDASGEATPEQRAARALAEVQKLDVDTSAYETVASIDTLAEWIEAANAQGFVALDTETSSLDGMQADLIGVSLALAPGRACYIPIAHTKGDDLLAAPVAGQVPLAQALATLKPMLEDDGVLKIGQNLKYDWLVLAQHGITLRAYDDTMLMSYVLDSGKANHGGHGMDDLSRTWLNHQPIAFKDLCGTGKNQIGFAQVPIDKATAYAAEDADVTLRLWMILRPRLAAEGVTGVYETLERPMVATLAKMEQRGVKVDRQQLSRLSGELAQAAAAIEADIHKCAGETFNVGSPKQIGEILFGKFGLPGGKKTKTGAWSTSASVMEDLAAQGHDLPQRILDWRTLSKLKSTYTDTLPDFINPVTGRVHTSFALAATPTGRLSSSDPNVQNIPVRTREGRKIRATFIAEPGNRLVCADYSQIELRVLAHIADIVPLKQAFADGLDIHAMTASEMFNVPIADMDPMIRRRAKAINFGIIYGISAFGLANQLGIPQGEAKTYIDTYFKRFPGIRTYMEETKKTAKTQGYVETLFGRKCHYPEINSKNHNMRAFMERAAINAPIQGSAADIIRRAMVRMDEALEKHRLDARMLMQVHDELVFEVREDDVDRCQPVICQIMEDAPMPALNLSVPLVVDTGAAVSWDEAH